MNETNYGMITEQGFPVGSDLGFKPLTEAEREKLSKRFEEEDKKDNE